MREKAEMARRLSQEQLKRTKGKSRRGSTISENFKKTNGSRNRRESRTIVSVRKGSTAPVVKTATVRAPTT